MTEEDGAVTGEVAQQQLAEQPLAQAEEQVVDLAWAPNVLLKQLTNRL